MQPLHLKRNSVWHESHFLYLLFLQINLFANKFAAHLRHEVIDKFVEIANKFLSLRYYLNAI